MRLLAVLVIASIAASAAAYHLVEGQMMASGTERPEPVLITVAPGTSFRAALIDLEKAGLLADSETTYYRARIKEKTAIRSGTYRFTGGESAAELLRILNVGRVITERLTIAEGLNRWQIRDLMVREGWMDAESFDRLCDDESLLQAHAIPAKSCEGFLFPETYTLARGLLPKKIFSLLYQTYRSQFDQLVAGGRGPLELGELEFVTLASIVEKETGKKEERSRVAAVFINRLRIGLRLQSDPTVIYGLKNFNGNLTRKHLRTPTPYNTYTRYGLPPTPITNPGRESLKSTLFPAQNKFLYFVARGDGSSKFSKTLREHNKAVWYYQKVRKNRQAMRRKKRSASLEKL